MIVSDKKISLAIILIFLIGLVFYFFLWFGWVEILINDAEIQNFTVKTSKKTYQCNKNPCKIKFRAKKRIVLEINHPSVAEKNMVIDKTPLWQKSRYIIKTIPPLETIKSQHLSFEEFQEMKENPAKKLAIENKVGPILLSSANLGFFIKQNNEDFDLMIANQKNKQKIASLNSEIRSQLLEKNFSLSENGIIIPAKNAIYYFDLAEQRLSHILSINPLLIRNISVNENGKQMIFYNLREKSWQIYNKSSLETKTLNSATNFAGFWQNKIIEIRGNEIYLGGQKKWKTDKKINKSDDFQLINNQLFILQDLGVLEINLQ